MTPHDLAYTKGRFLVDYGREVEEEIARLQEVIEKVPELTARYSSRWLAIKLLEDDKDVIPKVEKVNGEEILSQARKSVAHLQGIYNEDVDTIIASRRYGFISGLVKEAVRRPIAERLTFSDKVDKVVTNRILGIPHLPCRHVVRLQDDGRGLQRIP